MANLEKLKTLTEGKTSNWAKDAKWRADNKDWLRHSFKIAVRILFELKEKNLSQKTLAEKMNVSPQYINKMVKGKEKLNLETICKLERALSIKLISIIPIEDTQIYTMPLWNAMTTNNEITKSIKSKKMDLAETANYSSKMTLRQTEKVA